MHPGVHPRSNGQSCFTRFQSLRPHTTIITTPSSPLLYPIPTSTSISIPRRGIVAPVVAAEGGEYGEASRWWWRGRRSRRWTGRRWTRWCGASSKEDAAGARCSCRRRRSASSASRPKGCSSRSPTSCASPRPSRSAVSQTSLLLPPWFVSFHTARPLFMARLWHDCIGFGFGKCAALGCDLGRNIEDSVKVLSKERRAWTGINNCITFGKLKCPIYESWFVVFFDRGQCPELVQSLLNVQSLFCTFSGGRRSLLWLDASYNYGCWLILHMEL